MRKGYRRSLAATGTVFTVLILSAVTGILWHFLDHHAFFSDRVRSERCHRQLQRIEQAKAEFAGLHDLTNGALMEIDALADFMPHGQQMIHCPGGGVYQINPIGTPPTCSIHSIPGTAHRGAP